VKTGWSDSKQVRQNLKEGYGSKRAVLPMMMMMMMMMMMNLSI
jgi:hypothetical protein